MTLPIDIHQLKQCGLTEQQANNCVLKLNDFLFQLSSKQAWKGISTQILNQSMPFTLHLFLFSHLFPQWQTHPETAPAWSPENELVNNSNISRFMKELHITSVKELHEWSVENYAEFWRRVIKKIQIVFRTPFTDICNIEKGIENPQWFLPASLNIVDSCFQAPPSDIAIIFLDKHNKIQNMSYEELRQLTHRVSNSLVNHGFLAGDAIAIDMPMTWEAVVIYLGIVSMGGIVVSIADSFSTEEIAIRLQITNTKAVFTQDYMLRGAKKISLYEKVVAANPPVIIVLPILDKIDVTLRSEDLNWESFLSSNSNFTALTCHPMDHCNILFSSGTTAAPKAIPWTHSTLIKVASDAYFHHNIQSGDILAWPTNLGWMMGPWLIFAALLNKATIALYTNTPSERSFGEFVQNAGVTMLGVVPTLVSSWRHSHSMENLDWHKIKLFSSTGECSNCEDMLYLMSLANYKPIIEYCGGTEIGGAYLTSTLIEDNYLSVFTTAALGSDFLLLDEKGLPSQLGEVALIPPALGLSTELLNADHHQVYFTNMPKTPTGKLLRRHGDQLQRLSNNYYRVLGRTDDTMNLSGVKISAAEIERAIAGTEGVFEAAAISANPQYNGPSQLVIYAVTNQLVEKEKIMRAMQTKINLHLNPLFKIYDIVFVPELPKTASNKIMRRVLKKQYQDSH